MRSRLICLLASALFVTAPVLAVDPPPPPPGADVPVAPDEFPDTAIPVRGSDLFRVWIQASYLGYWVKNAPTGFSIVTGNPADPTQVIFGGDQSLGMYSGFRLGVGSWLGDRGVWGWDANFMLLSQTTGIYNAASDANGNPVLAFPFINQTPGAIGDTFMPISSPGVFAGNIQVASTLQFFGAEVNGDLSLARNGPFSFVALAGFRYLDLRESMEIDSVSSELLTVPNTVLSMSDLFSTANQFYGGQIGGRLSWQSGKLGLDLTGKLALGMTHQTVDVSGFSSQTGPGGVNGTFPVGFFAEPSNIGHTTANQFGIIPSFEIKLNILLTPQLRAFVGYEFLYWSQVVRPGNQIDNNINLSQNPILGTGVLNGTAYPMPLFNRSDIWLQGLSLGIEYRF